jgi:hypothetical protein
VKASKTGMIADLKNGVVTAEELERRGDAFKNLTELYVAEKVVNRADDIATRLKTYPIVSPLWKTWINKTASYNATCKYCRV